jgi:hypothetical protein
MKVVVCSLSRKVALCRFLALVRMVHEAAC